MTEQQSRITWTTRINLRPQAADEIKRIALADRISVATMVGMAIETYVTARSTA
jgi:hypothetical protein